MIRMQKQTGHRQVGYVVSLVIILVVNNIRITPVETESGSPVAADFD